MPPEHSNTVADSAVSITSVPDAENQEGGLEQGSGGTGASDEPKSSTSNNNNNNNSGVLSKLSSALDSFQRRMCTFFVNHPGRSFGVASAVIVGVAFMGLVNMEISEATDYDWIVTDSAECDHMDIMTDIMDRVDVVGSDTKKSTPALSEDGGSQVSLQLLYETKEKGEKLFTPETVQAICEIESEMWNLEDFHSDFCRKTTVPHLQMPESSGNCSTPMLSITARFYQWPPFGNAESRECVLLSEDQVRSVKDSLFAQLKEPGSPTSFFFDSTDPESVTRTRSILSMGGPLKGYDNKNDRRQDQLKEYREFTAELEEKLWTRFGLENTFFRTAYRNQAVFGPVRSRFFSQLLSDLEFTRVVNSDLMWTLLAVTFVYGYITFHTGSFFLAFVGVMQILLSLPISFAFYYYLFQITFFSQLHILTIFLVLGVGADNVFVLVDSWRLFHKDPEFNSDTFTNLLPAYKRAFSAVFNTSLTTAMAFVSTSVSPIMPISTFGVYAAVAILVNYLYVIFFMPSAVMIQYYYFSKSCLFWRAERPFYQTITWENAKLVDLEELAAKKEQRLKSSVGSENVERVGLTQRFFQGPYTRFITSRVGATATVLVFLAVMAQGIFFAFRLEPPKETEKWFSDDHMWTGLMDTFSTEFLAGPDNSYVSGSLTWGVEGIDRSEYDPYKPGVNRGETIFFDEFDISTREAQQVILDSCVALREKECDAIGCMDNSGMLVRYNSVECWLEDMQAHHNGTLPTGEAFLPALVAFRDENSDSTNQYGSSIGVVDGELRFARIPFVYTMESRQPMESTNSVKDTVNEVVSDVNEKAPATIGDTFAVGQLWFAWVKTEEWLVRGMFLGFAICFPVAFLVLLIATGGNALIAAYATVSIVGIVATVLGLCESVFQWDLGVAESIAAVIVVGFSVDYVCHLSHAYADSASPYRRERTADAARTMASTVAAGGMTTLGAGVCMFGCQMVFFSKMAILISLTISLSLGFSLGFFMALCSLAGPQGKVKTDPPPTKHDHDNANAD